MIRIFAHECLHYTSLKYFLWLADLSGKENSLHECNTFYSISCVTMKYSKLVFFVCIPKHALPKDNGYFNCADYATISNI